MTVSKSAAKSVNLPVGSATALLTWANDASNWSGAPMVNDTFGRSTGGYVAKLVAAGMVTAIEDGEETFVSFTPEGIKAALALGANDSFLVYYTSKDEAAKPAKREVKVVAEVGETIQGLTTVELNKVCKNGANHEFRVTQSGSYCYTCDRIAAEAQKAARAAAKEAAAAE